ncbi:hypothetical protein CVT25_006852 [Psilocybe cyanescens]|uniref:SH3 domain-containing protein n=1 Tax=Psilocybe cyanescens TaxID=93625 RepID=A0A409XTZ1_PSICY|nr:hypothetical protein CVT25_006852 [Psilocybe cyanescens]
MVFSNLQPHEKEAFFSLLDEYFSARPEIFANAAHSDDPPSTSTAQGAAVSAVGRAMASNPETTAKFMSAGLRQISNARSAGAGSGGPVSSANASTGAGESDNEAVTSVAGRVAAFANSRNNQPTPSSASSSPQIAERPSGSLVSVKKFGNSVDMSSGKGFIGSLRSKPSSPPQVAIPSAFAPKQNNFAPPPRRTASASSSTPEPAAATPPPPAPRFQQPKYEEPEPEEPEGAGEWADALYDYNSGEAGDLVVSEGDRILVVERTSDDWWTGEVNGKKGLFPASYVKLL